MPGHAFVPFKMRCCVPNGLIDTIMLECHPWVWWETARCTGAVQSCKKKRNKTECSPAWRLHSYYCRRIVLINLLQRINTNEG